MVHPIPSYRETFRRTQFWPVERLVEHQYELLGALVRHARDHVPFYRDSGRLDPLFRRDGTIDWNRWGEIPVLKRAEIQRAGKALLAESIPKDHGATWPKSSSGSTGEPVTVVHTELAAVTVWVATLLRDLERHRIDPTRRAVYVSNFEPGRRENWYRTLEPLGIQGERIDIPEMQYVGDLVEQVVSLRPAYLRVQAVTLELILAHDRERCLSDLGIERLMTVGDHFPEPLKRAAETHFGCGIADLYSSQECGRIAMSCPHCGRYHVNADTQFVEVIADDGGPTPPGEAGWIIVTPLYNFAMPLIRYDHVDQVRVGAPGGCEIMLPALDAVVGKNRTPFRFPDGSIIRPALPITAILQHLAPRAYQVAQIADDRCEFRIVPGRLQPWDMNFGEMTKLICKLWWDKLEIDYRIVREIPGAAARGKILLFVREVPENMAVMPARPAVPSSGRWN